MNYSFCRSVIHKTADRIFELIFNSTAIRVELLKAIQVFRHGGIVLLLHASHFSLVYVKVIIMLTYKIIMLLRSYIYIQ